MKKSLRLFFFAAFRSVCNFAFGAGTQTSYMIVKVAPECSGQGMVAVQKPGGLLGTSKPSDPKYPSGYSDTEMRVDNSQFGFGSSVTFTYYVYAYPAEGYEFDHWAEGSANYSTDANTTYAFEVYSGNVGRTLTAYFRKITILTLETNNDYGYITLSNDDVKEGETVTVTASTYPIDTKNINMMTYFDHWEDGDGVWLSDEAEYTFEAKRMTVRAIFATKGETPQPGKYYRVRNAYNRVLTQEGSFMASLSASNLDVSTALLRWALPLDYDPSKFNAGSGWDLSDEYQPIWAEATPGTIFYIKEGKVSGDKLTEVVLEGQGVNTYDVTGYKLSVEPIEQYHAYYTINSTVSGQDVMFKALTRDGYGGVVNVSRPIVQTMVAMAVQPIDEAHIDDFWFGAYASREAFHEGGYWTSMYTAFPYKLHDDGVEAYYIKTQQPQAIGGNLYLTLEKIEDGIVPANTAVFLKCETPEDTKANRLLPLDPSTVSKTIDDNILDGAFQLYAADPEVRGFEDKDTRIKNKSGNYRVLGVNKDGKVGLYKLAGEETLLAANKAYLDMGKLPSEVSALSISFGYEEGTTGVEGVVVDNEPNADSDVIYDLYGRRVTNPSAGNIYIMNGKKVILK